MFCRKCGMNNADGARFCAGCGAEMPVQNTNMKTPPQKKNYILIIVLFIVLLIAVAAAAFFAAQKKKEKDYETNIDSGEHYLEKLDYEKAEDFYLAAIEINPKEEEPYLRLAEIYSVQNQPEKAKDILEKGIEQTDSRKLKEKYSLYTYVEDVLIPEIGQAKTGDYEWTFPPEYAGWEAEPIRNVSGVITSRIMDFDDDGDDELLVVILKNDAETLYNSNEHNAVYLEMYENEDGDVVKYAEYLACDDVLGAYADEMSGVFLKENDETIYICGGEYGCSLYGNEFTYSSFVLTYQEDHFQKYAGTDDKFYGEFSYSDYQREAAEEMAELLDAIDLPKAAEMIRTSNCEQMTYMDAAKDMLFQIGMEFTGYEFIREDDGGSGVIHFWLGSEEASVIEELPEASALEILNEYGYYEADENTSFNGMTGASCLIFGTEDGSVQDMGDYYLVDARFYKQIKVSSDTEVGDQVTVVVNELTGEEVLWTCTSKDEYGIYFGEGRNPEYKDEYYTSGEPDEEGMLPVFMTSYDAVCALIYEGELAVMKTAIERVVIDHRMYTVSEEILENGYWNCVYFNEKGYATQLVYYGD